jgi:GNAT superfamily N-acetyltransferase
MADRDYAIEPLAKDHDRGEFSCGKAPLDAFIRTQAGQYERNGSGRTFVAVAAGSRRVVGYYTLAASAVEAERLPARLAKKLPRHPAPAILLGRLAIDRSAQGKGLGADLLVDALGRSVAAAEVVGAVVVLVHAIDDEAKRFYLKYGFIPLADQDRHLILPVATARQLF